MPEEKEKWNFSIRAGRWNRNYKRATQKTLEDMAASHNVGLTFTDVEISGLSRGFKGYVTGSEKETQAFVEAYTAMFS